MKWGVARRENNNKRSFVIVNSDLCKHVPNNPGSIKYELANKLIAKLILEDKALNERHKIIVIGFAETATALGYFVAEGLKALLTDREIEYTTTTRHKIDGKDYAEFTESHSHATEQFILKEDIKSDMRTEFIIVDDEITTGNTAFKLINVIEELNGKDSGNTYCILAPIINKQVHKRIRDMLNPWITAYSLTELGSRDYDVLSHKAECNIKPNNHKEILEMPDDISDGFWNIGLATDTSHSLSGYKAYIDRFAGSIGSSLAININPAEETLVDIIGCEENMVLAIKSGIDLQDYYDGNKLTVLTHSITRSPIEPSNDSLLVDRLELPSFYGEYNTYIYNSNTYDKSKFEDIIVALVFPVEMDARNRNILRALTRHFKSKGADKVIIYTYRKSWE